MRSLKKISSSKSSRLRLNDQQEILLSAVLNKPREYLIAHAEIKISAADLKKYQKLDAKLKKGWPLAYLLGYRWFFGRKFFVNQNVLIPRPETELLVERGLKIIKTYKPQAVVDVGTGSGAIIVSLRANSKIKAEFIGADISTPALKIAKKNSKGFKIELLQGSFLKPLKNLVGKKILITANLPYLSKKQLSEKSIIREPKLALYGGKQSHKKIEQLIIAASKLKTKDLVMLLEINYDQAKFIRSVVKRYLPGHHCSVHKDYSGFDRVVEIKPKFLL